MIDHRIKKLALDACGWYHNTAPVIPGVRDPVRAYYKSFKSCGQPRTNSGQQGFRECKKAACYWCSKRWAIRQTKSYVAEFEKPDLKHEHFRMITLGLGLYGSVEECFSAFSNFRSKLRNSLDRKRVRKKASSKADLWRKFSLAGSLEIDLFRVDQFDKLGSEKKRSYTGEYGFDKNSWVGESVWVVTFHGVMFLGDLSEEEVETFLSRYCKRVHLQPMQTGKVIETEIKGVLGYSVKTLFKTCMDCGRSVNWRQKDIREYIISSSRFRGRQAFKLYIGRKE